MGYLEIQNLSNPMQGPVGFLFSESQGIRVQKFDPGYPENRVVADPRPFAHGSFDYTKYFGPREVSIEFMILPQIAAGVDRATVIDTLRGLCNPALTCYLIDDLEPSRAARRILIKPSQFSIPYEFVNRNYGQISWRCPDGYWEDYNATSITIGISSGGGGGGGGGAVGRQYPLIYPKSFGGVGSQPPPVTGNAVQVGGNIETYPVVRLNGPFSEGTLTNSTTTKQLKFNPFNSAVGAGEYVSVDFRNKTALRGSGSVATESVYDKIDWSVSQWWSLPVGTNSIAFSPVGNIVGVTNAQVSFRNAWI